MPWGNRKVVSSKQSNGPQVGRSTYAHESASTKQSHGRHHANGSLKPAHRQEKECRPPNPVDAVIHWQFPRVPVENRMFVEAYLLFFSLLALFLQNLVIYNTSIYLANKDLIFFATIVFTRHFLWTWFDQISPDENSGHNYQLVVNTVRYFLMALTVAMFIWFIFQVMRNDSITNSLMLIYPGFLYVSLFGLSTENDRNGSNSDNPTSSNQLWLIHTLSPYTWISSPLSPALARRPDTLSLPSPHHEIHFYIHCFSIPSPVAVRQKVDCLLGDLYSRIKRLFFHSVMCTYYASFLPLQFVQQDYLSFDKHWCYKHLVFVWVNIFAMMACESFPVSYCVTLYKCAVHLGSWKIADSRKSYVTWDPNKIWPSGIVVEYEKNWFGSVGYQVVSEPGNSSHFHFYCVFNNLTVIPTSLLIIQILSVCYQLVLLFYTSTWQHAVLLTSLLFFGCYPIYKTFRNWITLTQSAFKKF